MAKVAFTAGRVAAFKCPESKAQAFLWDSITPGLGLRATPAGKPSYVFQSRFNAQTVRITIGSPDDWPLESADMKEPDGQKVRRMGAREKARELQSQIDAGRDPREVKAEATAADLAKRHDAKRLNTSAREAWDAYILERTTHWGARHLHDHKRLSGVGGTPGKRGAELQPGILASLLAQPLRDLDSAAIEAWAAREAKTRPTSARLAWRLLKAFLGWCSEQPTYAGVVSEKNPAKSKRARESLGKPGVKSDALQREQLPAWFAAVRGIHNPVVAAYCQAVLLTGARPGEVLEMRWVDLNAQWKGLTIRDKVEGERTIPLTPYVAQLLGALPRRNEWVFSSATVRSHNPKNVRRRAAYYAAKGLEPPKREPSPIVAAPNELHSTACKVAGLDGLTLHGLRRSFKSLTEWLEIPAGVVAQLMGHKPSATAERHYTVRPLDLLRVHHERIEAWILKEAKVEFDPAAAPAGAAGLRLVSAA